MAGQVTIRGEDPAQMWAPALDTGLEETEPANLLRVDATLQTLEGAGRANPGVRFHQWIYRHRPDVGAIVHTHPPALSAFSMLGIPLPVAHMDAVMFHDDCGYLARWPWCARRRRGRRTDRRRMKQYRTVLLVNHGAVCVGRTLQEATYLAVFAERNARLCLDALAAGRITPIEPHAASEAHDFLLQPSIVDATFDYWCRQALRR